MNCWQLKKKLDPKLIPYGYFCHSWEGTLKLNVMFYKGEPQDGVPDEYILKEIILDRDTAFEDAWRFFKKEFIIKPSIDRLIND